MSSDQSDNDIIDMIDSKHDEDEFEKLHWQGNFSEYLGLVRENPKITRNAFQRIYDMIMSYGTSEYTDIKKRLIRYKFFDDPENEGKDAVYGLDVALMKLVNVFKSAARGFNTNRRVILLHGPVGSSKSTIARLLKRGLERYSIKEEGALYTFEWKLDTLEDLDLLQKLYDMAQGSDISKESLSRLENMLDGALKAETLECPMHEEPLVLVPKKHRKDVFERLSSEDFKVYLEADSCPVCRFVLGELEKKYKGRWKEIVKHVNVKRMLLSEKDRRGIGTFQPKDEKNQDSTELTGDVNFRKLAEYGSDSDPRAFNFDGELNIANRGLVEFIEILKLDVAFLYDLLGASQEHSIKPKKFSQTDIDEVIIGHTNNPDFRRIQNDEFMEALNDRTIKVDITYITKWQDEGKIYKKDYSKARLESRRLKKHIAPHTLEMAAQWAVLTRLEEPKKHNLTLVQKMKLYQGQKVTGFSEDDVKELRKEAENEGFSGISPRYIQDKMANALVTEKSEGDNCVGPFLLLNEIEAGLKNHTLIRSEDERKRYKELLTLVKQEYEDIVKNEVQMAICADDNALKNLCSNYIDNVKAYTQREKVKNRYTGQDEQPDERLMRSIEEKVDIPDTRKDDFRTELMNFIGALAVEGKQFEYAQNERLMKALKLKLFEDQKDTIKLTSLVSSVVDKDAQEKIDVVKQRLIANYGYCDVCATNVLSFVSSIFARGDAKE